jgi:hypothetical protein
MIWFIVGGWCEKNNQWYKIFFYDWEMRDDNISKFIMCWKYYEWW